MRRRGDLRDASEMARVVDGIRALVSAARLPVADAEPSNRRDVDFGALTAREIEVVTAWSTEPNIPRVARRLSLSDHTVRNHLRHVYEKLGVHSQAELMALVAAGSR